MFDVLFFLIGIPVFALLFSLVTLLLGLFSADFTVSGDGGFVRLYTKFLAVAAVYVTLARLHVGGFISLAVLGVVYKYVFAAGWKQAFWISLVGGLIGWGLMIWVLLTWGE